MAAITSTPDHSTVLVLPSAADLGGLSDADLQSRMRAFAAVQREVDTRMAKGAAEIARRSSPELGHSGLAAREGLRSPEQLIERLSGVTSGEAHAMVRVGRLMDCQAAHTREAHEAVVVASVSSGDLSVLAAEAILTGLGDSTSTIDASALEDAAVVMVGLAAETPIRRLAAEARALRDDLDTAGIAAREAAMRERRFLRLTPHSDGMTRVTGLLDPESAAIITSAFDQITAPRRGGPRFVDPTARAHAQSIVDDARTTPQLMADALVEMVRIASAADPGTVFAQRSPAVQIHVDLVDLEAGTGGADLDGQSVSVSVETARRFACSSGQIAILFRDHEPLDVGRSSRLFTHRQRVGLAARDGGCAHPDCDLPPSWTEAHHIRPWSEGGGTDIANGILLCRFHHLNLHATGARIERRGSDHYLLAPPGDPRLDRQLRQRNIKSTSVASIAMGR